MAHSSKIQLEEKNVRENVIKWLNIGFLISIIVVSFAFLEVNPVDILVAPISMIIFMVENFFPPNLNNLSRYFPAILTTLFFAVAATYFSAFFAFIFGVLMSKHLNPSPVLRNVTRYFVSFLRNIPVLIWAQLLIFVFGIGNMVGLVALVFATVGFLARSYGESMDDIAGERLEAIQATGANYMQILVHGVIPEFTTSWLNWTLYSFEVNIRISAILGVVGAGGIGAVIQTNILIRNFTEASTLIIILVIMVIMTELAVGYIRKKII